MARIACALTLAWFGTACAPGSPAYLDPAQPTERRVADLLGRMTREEKFWQLFAIPDDTALPLSRLAHGVYGLQVRPRLGGGARDVAVRINTLQRHFVTQTRLRIPMLPFEEALHGLAQGGATVFPQAIGLAATWDTAIVRRVASAIARETRARGIRQVLSPVVNVATDVRWGRVEETHGEDPLLSSRMGVAFVAPFERAGIVATPKHFVANVGDGGRDSYPIDLSERWLQELHFPSFVAAIREGRARSVMASYNSVGGSPASASRWLLTDKLRREMGFGGVVISDAGAVGGANVLHMTSPDYPNSAKLAIDAGLDVIFQTSADHAALFWPAFANGSIAAAVIDTAVARVLRLKFELGLFEQPYVAADSAAASDERTAHRALAREAARAAITLLANDGVLPLSRDVRRLTLIGPDAVEARFGGYSGPGTDPVSIRAGLEAALGASAQVTYEPGPGRGGPDLTAVPATALGAGLAATYFDNITLTGPPAVSRTDRTIDFNWPFAAPDSSLRFGWDAARWTGTLTAPATATVQLGVDSNDGARLYLDGRLIVDTWQRPSLRPAQVEVPLVRGRTYLLRLEYHENVGAGRVRLVWNHGVRNDSPAVIARAVSAARASDAAVIVAGLEEGEFRDRASLRLPGRQEELIGAVAATGRPVVVVLIGGSAVTMTNWIDQVDAVVQAWYPGEEGGHAVADVLLGRHNPSGRLPITFPRAEGQLPLSYYHKPTGRGNDYLDLTGRPLFPFGHGLSYSRFTYRDLAIDPAEPNAGDTVTVRVQVRNEGPHAGAEVVQLYLRDEIASVARPVMMLAAFERVQLNAGSERDVQLVLPPDRFSLLDERMQRRIESGRFIVLVGASSADIRLRGEIMMRQGGR
ncbi:MAG: glycoside hydrolase family 3 N-terminal domain-containing protein [Gemmatimonadaceae bacterium]